jgi:nitrogen fixation/metabolism regulation signal transduction histidine kinase
MTADAQRLSSHSGRAHPPRKLRNYLLEPKFQLKYTSMVVGVTVVVASVLGHYAYQYSTGQTQLLNMKRMETRGNAADARFISDLDRYARDEDRKVLLAVLGGIGVLALALGATGIVVTHRLVGPAYRLKQLLRQVRDGHIHPRGKLRKHDELQDVFESFQDMVESLRSVREQQIQELDEALKAARDSGADDKALAAVRAIRDRLSASLE